MKTAQKYCILQDKGFGDKEQLRPSCYDKLASIAPNKAAQGDYTTEKLLEALIGFI